ncbi:MAG: suppressor of fused domain protein [Flavobacteriales bacterium]|nr:suppressor of fused domain protein [Flavobacteriales bacterium]
MTLEEYRATYTPEDAVGWRCIDARLATLYGTRKPRHYVPPLHFIAGGTDPLDGTSYYDHPGPPEHIHVVSYGLSELYYNEEAVGQEFSKLGFELTFRIKRNAVDDREPTWITTVMNNLARYLHKSGRWFEVNEFVPAGGPLCTDMDTDITGVVFALDPELGKIDTPHGEVSFLQLVGITSAELAKLQLDPTTDVVAALIAELRASDPLLVTDMHRR